jgi:hypothetical protein
MLKKMFVSAAILSLVVLATSPWPVHEAKAVAPEPPGLSLSVQGTAATSLLANGSFDQGGFYWRPTNHFVADQWYEWWAGGQMPEYIDGGSPYHNACYPAPPPGGLCSATNNHSQGYIRWGIPFIAGIYQPVPATACTYYQFTAYNRNDEPNYHPKVGIEPRGFQLPINGGNPPNNCPPTGGSSCPNPNLNSVSDFPATMVWSPEFDHGYFWQAASVTAEALSSTISVWTYTAPDSTGGPSRSAYWDEASLVQVPPPSGILNTTAILPAADGKITNVTTSTTAIRANLAWQTTKPAVTQVLYHYVSDPAQPITHSLAAFELHTPVDSTASTSHSARLANLRPQSAYDYAILSRKLEGNNCQTSVLTGRLSTTDALLENGPLPPPSGIVAGPIILPSTTSAYVIWQSAQPSYGQVLYHHVVTPTLYPNRIYLPLVFGSGGGNGLTSSYEFRTPPDLALSTLHVITITSNLTPNERYTAAAVSAWGEGNPDETTASAPTPFRTASTTLMVASANSGQLVEQLQACLSEGKKLNACVDKLSR